MEYGSDKKLLECPTLYQLIVYRTFELGIKILQRRDHIRLYWRIVERSETGEERVKTERKMRTQLGSRTLSQRFARIWSLLTDEEKAVNLKNRSMLKTIGRRMEKWDLIWVLWGKEPNTTNNTTRTFFLSFLFW